MYHQSEENSLARRRLTQDVRGLIFDSQYNRLVTSDCFAFVLCISVSVPLIKPVTDLEHFFFLQ